MSSYRSGSVGRFDYSLGSGGSGSSSSSRYRPSQPSSSSSYTSRYSSTANPISSTSIGSGGGGGLSRSYRAASYDPFSSDISTRSTGITSYRSPYNRESSALDRPSAAAATMSNSYSDYTSKSRYGSDRYGSGSGGGGVGGYKPSSTSSSIMSSSYTSALPASSYSSSAAATRYKGSTTTMGFPPPRSTSYASGLSFEPTSTSSRYGSGIPSRTSGIGMSSSTYTPSTSSSSYYSRPRIDYRSQTPSSITREPPTTSRFDREYRSMSRFDVKEPSVDRVEETFSKLYNRYVRGSEKIKTPSSSSSSTTSSNQNSPIVKKFISHSEAEEEEFSCESEPEIDYTKSLLQKSKVAFELPEKRNEAKEKTPTPGTAAPNKSISTSSSSTAITTKSLASSSAVVAATDKSAAAAAIPSLPQQQKNVVQQSPLIAVATKITAAATIKETPDKGSTKTSVTKSVAATKAASPAPTSSKVSAVAQTSRSKSPAALTKASFEEKYKDLPKTEVVIEPKQIKGTSELDKLLRIAEFEKNPNKILSTALPKVVQSAVKAVTPAPAKPVIEKAPVKASSEAPSTAATVKIKETIPAATVSVKKEVSKEKALDLNKKVTSSSTKEIKKEKTPEPTKKVVSKDKTPEPSSNTSIPVIKKELSEKPRSRSKSPAPQSQLRSRSKSPSSVKSSSTAPEKQSLASKRAQRRERTIEMEKYVNSKLEQAKQEQEAADKVTELPKVTSERKPPLLLVTQPSVPSTPISLSANIVWNSTSSNPGEEGSESEWDEEDEGEEEDEEFYSEDDYDFTISLPSTGAPRGDLYPVDDSNRLRSITPYSDYDSEFEIPFIQPDSRNDSRGRVSQSNAAPPPIFLASVTYDGQDEWGSKNSADSDPDESQYFTVGSRLGVDSAGSRTYLSPVDFPSEEDEYLDNVDVGCTLTLLDKAALKGSDEETDSEFYSEYTDEEYTEEEYSYYEEEEEEYYTDEEIEEEVDEEWEDDIEMTASLYLPPTFKKSASPEPRRAKTPEPISSTVKTEIKKDKTPEPSKKAETKAKTPEPKSVTKEKTPEPKKAAEIKKEKIPEPSKSVTKEKTPEPKKVVETKTSVTKEKTPEPSKTASIAAKTKTPEPNAKKEVEVKKAADVKKEKTPEPKKAAEIKKEKTPEPKKSVETKTETKSTVPKVEPTKTVTKPAETTLTSKPTAATTMPKLEDKSAIRKSTLNMAEIERKKAEEKQAEIDRQNARLSGAVSSMRNRFRDPTPPKAEKITYRRSKLLQAREEIRPKRTYAPIVKPVLNDEFDKQMEEIREKMKKGSHKLQAEYTNLSKGINSEVDERKLKSLESKHKDLIGNTQTLLTKAEEEKKRFSSKNESETEKRYRETQEKEEAKLRRLEEEKRAAMLAHPEPKRTVRRSKKKAEEEAAKAGLTEPASLIPETSSSISNKSAAIEIPPAPKVPASAKKEEPKSSLPSSSKIVEQKKVTPTTAAAVAAPTKSFIPEAKKDDSDLELMASAMAKKKPVTVSDSVKKSEAGGVAALLRRKAEKAASPIPSSKDETATTEKSPEKSVIAERGPRRYSARRKTEEIIPPLKIELKENERKRKVQPHRKNRYTKKPFDIDALLGWEKENATFEKMEEFFEKQNFKRSSPVNGDAKIKKRRIESQKIWISELKDIDKIYKASELRDIKMTAVS